MMYHLSSHCMIQVCILCANSTVDLESVWYGKTPYEVFEELSGLDARIVVQGIPLESEFRYCEYFAQQSITTRPYDLF